VGLYGPQEIYKEKVAKALAKFKFRRLGKRFCGSKILDEIPLCKILYFVRGTGILAE
jgi:hypothetical protein